MSSLDKLEYTLILLKSIHQTANAILRQSVAINKKMNDSKDLNSETLKKLKKFEIEEFTKESNIIKKEMNKFINNTFFSEDENNDGYLHQVWNGDIYGDTHADALQKLNDELKNKLKNYTIENLLKNK
jgi:hypothetical protein